MIWLPIKYAPKDRPILGWCDHEADEYYEVNNRLTTYSSYCEGLSHVMNGPSVLVWAPEQTDVDDYGRDSIYPAYWFLNDDVFETVANPTHFQYIISPQKQLKLIINIISALIGLISFILLLKFA